MNNINVVSRCSSWFAKTVLPRNCLRYASHVHGLCGFAGTIAQLGVETTFTSKMNYV